MGNVAWKVMTAATAVGASVVARKLTDGTWKFVTGSDSPQNPDDPDIEWKEAIAFAVLSGVMVGVARMLAHREATQVYKKATGHLPKELLK
ncbi:DUF4235 domain-containing protein [Ornithinicoccus halotolerans]|uniref:DUF4235 domain-containing protein n=1 Tax=Ornithinicoccus halotolerans TaxID=1748220 RepID=UPI001297DDBF|nr:DUF4235 domain-containing protein [Ornithinicoccus halotolerans]